MASSPTIDDLQGLETVPGVTGPEPASFTEFWPYYVSQHLHPATRHLHVWGPITATVVGVGGAAAGHWWTLLLAVALGYGIAWTSHLLIERNRPATFGNPLWSLRGDLRLIRRYVTGRLEDDVREVRRAAGLTADQRTLADRG